MRTPITNLGRVRAAKDQLDDHIATMAPTDRERTRLEALRAVVNADENDRRTGLTSEYEQTPGLSIAHDVLASEVVR